MAQVQYKATLFDLDGTLLDTLEDLADSMNAVLECRGLPTHEVEEYKFMVGDGVSTLARKALPMEWCGEQTIADCVMEMRDEYKRRWDKKTRPYDGIPDLLDALTGRGLALTVLSNKPDDFTRLCISKFLGNWRFDAIQGVDEGVRKKPDPSGALTIAAKLDIPPAEFLYVGDTNTDMQTAVAAGMYPVGALWGFRTAGELLASGAKVLIERPGDLLKLL
jgi:phosphoglycolate phosphatase